MNVVKAVKMRSNMRRDRAIVKSCDNHLKSIGQCLLLLCVCVKMQQKFHYLLCVLCARARFGTSLFMYTYFALHIFVVIVVLQRNNQLLFR